MHPLLRRIFENRNVRARRELDYRLENLHPPAELMGNAAAAAILHAALEARSNILVVGDYDVDGASASALALLVLRAFAGRAGGGDGDGHGDGGHGDGHGDSHGDGDGHGVGHSNPARVDYLVPNRFRHGYGLSRAVAEVALQRRPTPQLVITVDNGIASVDGVALLRAAGVEVVVTDHHLAGAQLPNASAIVNPNQPGCAFPSKALAGVGVMFYVLLALRARLRAAGWFDGRAEVNLAEYLDLVALGTVADLVALDHNNRILVAQGVARIRAGRCRPGIRALAQVAGRRCADLDSTALGFVIGPRLNAAGRMDDMAVGIECLLAEDIEDAMRLAGELHAFNARRHQVQKSMLQQAEALVARLDDGHGGLSRHPRSLLSGGGDGDSHSDSDGGKTAGAKKEQGGPAGLCLFDADWHQGITGLVAARVKDKFHRPVVAFAPADDGQLRGSARSIAGLHIRDLLAAIDAEAPHLIDKFGGHAMAAGLSIGAQHLDEFARRFDALVDAHFDGQLPDGEILTDGELRAGDITLATAELLRDASPWGMRFPPPLFDGEFRVLEQRVVGDAHLKMRLQCVDGDLSRHPRSLLSGGDGEDAGDGDGDLDGDGKTPTPAFDAIAFRCIPPGESAPQLDSITAVYQLSVDEFRGRRRLQLVVEHWQMRCA